MSIDIVEGRYPQTPLIQTRGGLSSADLIKTILSPLKDRLGNMPYGSSDFETASPIKEDARSNLVRDMVSLPDGLGHRLFITSANLRQISEDAATHRALETMYVGPNENGIIDRDDEYLWARLFIENIHNSMAVRNRKRIVAAEFGHFLKARLMDSSPDIEVLSIAAGSSRALMEVIVGLDDKPRSRIRLKMVDSSKAAKDDAEKLAQQLGITRMEFVQTLFVGYRRYLPDGYRADFVEVVGLMDYLDNRRIVRLLSEVRDHLSEGGTVLYSNIAPNDEQEFTHRIVGWPDMNYRNADELEGFARKAGFFKDKIIPIREPLGVYNIVLARK